MKKILLLTCFIFCIDYTFSQAINNYEYIGTLQLPNNEIITYKLNFNESKNNYIEGASLSDIYGKDRTSSAIKGKINLSKQQISFSEIKNISTKSNANENEFCYVNVTNAKFRTINGKQIIQGKFKGKFYDGKSCMSGYIYLIGTNYLEKLEKEYLNSSTIKNADTLNSVKTKVQKLKERVDNNTLKSSELLTINWSSNEIVLELWDGEQEDLDEIQVFINDKKVVDQLILKRQKKIIVIPINEKVNTIKIVGINEGLSSPCTANLLLRDGLISTQVVSVLKKGESNLIKINKLMNEN